MLPGRSDIVGQGSLNIGSPAGCDVWEQGLHVVPTPRSS